MALLLALLIMDNKTYFMKFAGATLIIAGILMTIFFGNFPKEEKMADTDPVETSKEENKMLEGPIYGGALAVVAGVVIITLVKRKRK